MAAYCNLHRDAAVQLLVVRLVDNAHAAPSDFIEQAEPARHQFPELERAVQQLQSLDHTLGHEALHALFPQHPFLYLAVEIGVVAAGRAQIALPGFRRLLQRR